jgi:5'-3' exonuclease
MATLLLDSPSLIYRAFFGVPANVTDETGQPVNAVRGYLDMVSHLIRTEHPSRVIHTFDADWRPQFRVDAYPQYKAQRLADEVAGTQIEPDELTPQFDIIDEVLDAIGFEAATAAGFEADDVIGTLAQDATTASPAAIVTGDRDLFQLVEDGRVIVLFTVKGVTELRRVDEDDVLERYGISASRYADFATLRGDPSDGLPGVVGVGPKKAAALINAYPTVDALLADAQSQPPRLRDALLDAVDYLEAMKLVVPVRKDAPVEVVGGRPPEMTKVKKLASRYNLEGPADRLVSALQGD